MIKVCASNQDIVTRYYVYLTIWSIFLIKNSVFAIVQNLGSAKLLIINIQWPTESVSGGYSVLIFKFCVIRSSRQRCSVKKVFLEISQNSQENICARASILIKLQASGLQLYQNGDPGTGAFLWILWSL